MYRLAFRVNFVRAGYRPTETAAISTGSLVDAGNMEAKVPSAPESKTETTTAVSGETAHARLGVPTGPQPGAQRKRFILSAAAAAEDTSNRHV